MTVFAGLRPTQVVPPLAFARSTDRVGFGTYVQEVLLPALRPEDVVVWDNLQPHKNARVIATIEALEARVESLLVSSPDLQPIEEMGSKLKAYLRSVGARTIKTVLGA